MGPSGKWIAIDPDDSVDEAARRSLQARLNAVIHYLPLAAYHAEQNIEHVHRLRVSTRRAVAALELYRDWLPRKRARWVTKRLKKVRRTAGRARDLDVLAVRLTREYGERAAAVVTKIAQERLAVQPDIVRLAERLRRDDRFVRRTAKLVGSVEPPDGTSATDEPVIFRAWAAEQLTRVAEPFFAAIPGEDAEMEAIHQFRIRGKALRYAIELLASAFGPELRSTCYPIVEELQERLGKINDHVTACDQLREWGAEAENMDLRSAFCELAEQELASLADELAALRAWWTAEQVEQLSRHLAPKI